MFAVARTFAIGQPLGGPPDPRVAYCMSADLLGGAASAGELPAITFGAGYTALRESAAWIDLRSRGKIRVTGEDRVRLLHAMTTNHVQALKPGESCYLFFLNAQGRILGDANLLCAEDYLLLDTEPATRVSLYEHLDRYIIADDVALEDITSQLATIAVEGPAAAEKLQALGVAMPATPGSWTSWGDVQVLYADSTGSGGFLLFVPANRVEEMRETLALPEASGEEARSVRIERGKPRYGEEINERYLVQETDTMHAVHFTKGCYLGQEIVERVRSRAQIHRILRRMTIETDTPPANGTKLLSGEADAGEIVSASYSPALGATVAMAYVRMPFSEPGTKLLANGSAATVRSLR